MTRGLHARVAEGIVSGRLWSPGDRVAVAVSGGLDSTVLLDLLHRTRGVHGGVLSVVTVDHGMRSGSGADADGVIAEAERRSLPWQRHRVSLPSSASEAVARAARYAWLDQLDVEAVALAHHRDDQVETLLLGLLRGHGARSLAGMARVRGRYRRPLLDVSRAELQGWAAHAQLTWSEDPSNASLGPLRNRVRHELVPLLEVLRAGGAEAAARTAGLLGSDDAYLYDLAADVPFDGSWARGVVADGPEPVVRRALLLQLGEATTAGHVDAILAAARRGRGRIVLSEHVSVVVDAASVRIVETSGRS